MARFKLVNGQQVQLTAQEEAARDAEEAAWAAGNVVRLRERQFEETVKSAGAQFSDAEKVVLLALYSEVKLFRSDNTADTPLIDAIKAQVFPGQTKAQIGTSIESRVQTFLTTAAVALANKMKDGG